MERIASVSRDRRISDDRKLALHARELAWRQLGLQARQILAFGGSPASLRQLLERSRELDDDLERCLHVLAPNYLKSPQFPQFPQFPQAQSAPAQPLPGAMPGAQRFVDPKQIVDHTGKASAHGRELVNGVRLHYVTAGSGSPLLLLHGAPKTSYYWYKLFPLLTDRFTVIAPDIRGFGDSGKPEGGYCMDNIAEDLAQLMEKLGYGTYSVHGEDWGAAFAYALAAKYPDRVKKLSFSEMLLPGLGLEAWSELTPANVHSNHWFWHMVFFAVPDVPELLITGKEREFWGKLMRDECLDPSAISDNLLDEVVRGCSGAGGLRPIFNVYRNDFKNRDFVCKHMQRKLKMPVIAIGGEYFMDGEVHRVARCVAEHVTAESLDCGHCLALERPYPLAGLLRNFMG